MRDKDFLIWIAQRLIKVHGENENVDYILKLKSIIENMDKDKTTPNTCKKTIETLIAESACG